ncbi:MAG TPA: prepilin-type N-terminal cleavage/methylation domain-containing protein [Dissulfurispiraceae bacterium]|nr:prepilin-type N-terminal cleavage/methylation domain-containing protein [Dissulfurispiraceae bacterium]
MKNNRVPRQAGFSLVELLIAIAVGMVLLAAVSMTLRSGLQASTGIQLKASAQEDARLALQIMTAETGMASYNPQFRSDAAFWVTNACAASPNQNYRGIQEATATALTVEMAIGPGATGSDWVGDDPNEVIRYVYDAANQRITRATSCAGAQPFLGDTAASGRPREVLVVNNDLGLPVFRYFNGQGTELTSPVTAQIPAIRRIEITLAVQTSEIDPTTKTRKSMIYSTRVLPRNHMVE